MTRCTICSHSNCAAIDLAHHNGASNRSIATQYTVPETTLRRHFAKHLSDAAQAERRATPAPPARTLPRQQGQRIPPDIRPATQTAFLAAFIELANESGACRAVQVNPSTVRAWEEHDADFSLRYHAAKEEVNDIIRGEMFRRAVKGVAEPVVSAGKVMHNDDGSIMTVQKYSDTLIAKLGAARMPEFREKSQVAVTGADGGPIQTETAIALDPKGMTLEQLAALRQVLEHGSTDTDTH